jgi:hypothetical protein
LQTNLPERKYCLLITAIQPELFLKDLLVLFTSRHILIHHLLFNNSGGSCPQLTIHFLLTKDRLYHLSALIRKMERLQKLEVLEEKASYE